jgi:pimeloyl-ACP methyl ester carboxylesterase
MDTHRERREHDRSRVIRSGVQLADLKAHQPMASWLMNVKNAAGVASAIDQIAIPINALKTEVVIALLNEGLAEAVARLRYAAPLVLVLLLLGAPARAIHYGQVFVHGKGNVNLSDFGWAYDYWGNGQFTNAAQGCSSMPYTITHVDGTQGLAGAAFNRYDCGCGEASLYGCDFAMVPVNGIPGACQSSGPKIPGRSWTLKYKGVVEQINDFLNANGVDDLTVITHSMGGNVLRTIVSQPDFYDACAFGSGSQPGYPQCQQLRANHLRVINAISTVMALHAPFLGSEAADFAASLSGSWYTGWIADLLNPYDPSTRDCTTARMATLNKGLLRGTPGVPFLTVTQRGEPVRVARWIDLMSRRRFGAHRRPGHAGAAGVRLVHEDRPDLWTQRRRRFVPVDGSGLHEYE